MSIYSARVLFQHNSPFGEYRAIDLLSLPGCVAESKILILYHYTLQSFSFSLSLMHWCELFIVVNLPYSKEHHNLMYLFKMRKTKIIKHLEKGNWRLTL